MGICEVVKVKVAAPEVPDIPIGSKLNNQVRVVAWVDAPVSPIQLLPI
jgi:hypothetical protein